MLAKSQETNEELKKLKQGKSRLRFEKINFLETGITIFCHTSIGTPRPFLTKPFRRTAFNSIPGSPRLKRRSSSYHSDMSIVNESLLS